MGLELELKPGATPESRWSARIAWMRQHGVASASWCPQGELISATLAPAVRGDKGGSNNNPRSKNIDPSSYIYIDQDKGGVGGSENQKKENAPPTAVAEVWAKWVSKAARGRGRPPVLDNRRARAISDRLQEGFSVEQLCRAVDGIWASDWHRAKGAVRPEICFKDAAKVERFISMAPLAPIGPAAPANQPDLPNLADTAAHAAKLLEGM